MDRGQLAALAQRLQALQETAPEFVAQFTRQGGMVDDAGLGGSSPAISAGSAAAGVRCPVKRRKAFRWKTKSGGVRWVHRCAVRAAGSR